MPAAFGVGVREFVDQHDLRPPRDDGVEVHFVEVTGLYIRCFRRGITSSPCQQRFGLLAAVGFDHADDDVVAVFSAGLRLLQHLIGLADARRGADEDAKLADAPLFARRAASSRASGEGRCSESRRLIRHRLIK